MSISFYTSFTFTEQILRKFVLYWLENVTIKEFNNSRSHWLKLLMFKKLGKIWLVLSFCLQFVGGKWGYEGLCDDKQSGSGWIYTETFVCLSLKGDQLRQIRFRFDGQPVNETDTPAQVSVKSWNTDFTNLKQTE